ncbi:transcription termination factor 4, mitochondrial [Tiliqua scincoides]|uniref:transcription termination factor 4, mitochondrial n=1 Tax=Tiliqua scincoides TaxID=71010 RepID=UPI003461EA28
MRGLELGRLCAQVLRRHSLVPLARSYIQLSFLNSSPVAFFYSVRNLGCKSTGTSSSEQNEASLAPGSSKADSSEVTQKLLETLAVSPAEQQRPADMGHLKVLDSFLNMGFSSAQIVQLFSLQPNLPPQSRLTVVSELLLLGLSTDCTLKALQKSPEILKMSAKHLKDRAHLLRKLGFKEDNLNHVAIHFPSIFTLPQKRIQAVEHLLREKCLFTTQQISKLLQTCPNILLEELGDVEYKFQFAYFRMGVKQREMVKAGFFQASLTEIKNRFVFLERLGLYQTPDKKGQTQVVNPKMKSLIRASESDFVTKIACSSVEEYEIFRKLLAREVEQRWKQEEVLKSELLGVDSDGEDSDTELGH